MKTRRKTMTRFKITLIGLCLLIIMAQQVFGYQFKKTLKELVTSAPLIIEGKVIKVEPRYVKFRDNEKFIMTFVTLSVFSVIKGEYSNSSLIVSMRGGEIGEHAMFGDFSFQFNVDEDILLFLNPIDNEMWEIFGISGKLSIQLHNNERVCNCSRLKSDDKHHYGPATFLKYDDIIAQIRKELSKNGGN
jgi:hypothetical protein